MLTLFADTDCDFTPELGAQHGYKIISMPYSIDGKEVYPYEDFDVFDSHGFYDTLRKGVLPKTSAISMDKYVAYFEPEFAAGNDILYVHFSAAMSGTFNAMNLALAELKEKYPERKFYAIDTKGISILAYQVALEVKKMLDEGKSIDEVIAWAEENCLNYSAVFYVDNLDFLRRSGRVTGFAGIMGNLLNIHPIISMLPDGTMNSISKAQGKVTTLKKIIAYVEKYQDDIKNNDVYIAHTDVDDLADLLENMLKEKFGAELNIVRFQLNPTAGCHVGPYTIGVSFKSKGRVI